MALGTSCLNWGIEVDSVSECWQTVLMVRLYGVDYSQIFSRWVEVKATLPTAKLEHFYLELFLPTRSWEFMNPPAGS